MCGEFPQFCSIGVGICVPLALDALGVEAVGVECYWRWMLLALKLEFQCQKKPALKSALEFPIGVETSAIGVETAAIGVETATIGVEIGVESCYWR